MVVVIVEMLYSAGQLITLEIVTHGMPVEIVNRLLCPAVLFVVRSPLVACIVHISPAPSCVIVACID